MQVVIRNIFEIPLERRKVQVWFHKENHFPFECESETTFLNDPPGWGPAGRLQFVGDQLPSALESIRQIEHRMLASQNPDEYLGIEDTPANFVGYPVRLSCFSRFPDETHLVECIELSQDRTNLRFVFGCKTVCHKCS